MRPLISAMALGFLTLTALASHNQNQPPPQQSPETNTLKELKVTLLHSTAAEAGSHASIAPPAGTEGGGSAETYCQAATNSQGNVALIGHVGSLSLEESTFGLKVTGQTVHAGSFGMFTYGTNPTNVPFGNGYLCISPFNPGIYRMPTQSLNQATITLTMAEAESQFQLVTPGSSWYFQFWYRDPAAGNANFNLSNGLHVVFPPVP